jgi:hypothetical protein
MFILHDSQCNPRILCQDNSKSSPTSYHNSFPPFLLSTNENPPIPYRLPAGFGLPPTLGPKAFQASPLPDDVSTPDPFALPPVPREGASDGASEEDSSDSRWDFVSSEISEVSICSDGIGLASNQRMKKEGERSGRTNLLRNLDTTPLLRSPDESPYAGTE